MRRCGELGIAVDLSHLNLRGFEDVARVLDGPLIASHSCAHALCPSSRNLTDAQLDRIAASGGLCRVNLAVSALRADGRDGGFTAAEVRLIAHGNWRRVLAQAWREPGGAATGGPPSPAGP